MEYGTMNIVKILKTPTKSTELFYFNIIHYIFQEPNIKKLPDFFKEFFINYLDFVVWTVVVAVLLWGVNCTLLYITG